MRLCAYAISFTFRLWRVTTLICKTGKFQPVFYTERAEASAAHSAQSALEPETSRTQTPPAIKLTPARSLRAPNEAAASEAKAAAKAAAVFSCAGAIGRHRRWQFRAQCTGQQTGTPWQPSQAGSRVCMSGQLPVSCTKEKPAGRRASCMQYRQSAGDQEPTVAVADVAVAVAVAELPY